MCGQQCSEKYIRTAKKEFNKRSSFPHKASIAFDLAKCYKGVNDSIYKYWLTQTIENYKQGYGHPSHSQLVLSLYNTGYAYFELNDFKASETYFNKSIKCNNRLSPSVIDSTVYLYYGISLYNNKKYSDAVEVLKTYKIAQPTNKLADEYIEKCNNVK
jgi:tetratricopeptide (TPR) repeat protein